MKYVDEEKKMKILVACEESQAVTKELRQLNHEAYSCDIIDQSGGHPEWHIKQDVLPLLNGNCEIKTTDGKTHTITGKWDMIIAFPPCTDLSVSGAAWFNNKRATGKQRKSIEFFATFLTADCEKIAIENPVGIISGNYIEQWYPEIAEKYDLPKKPTQIIQPWMFGDNFNKKTCLWLKNISPLIPEITDQPNLEWVEFYNKKSGKKTRMPKWYAEAWRLPPDQRSKSRSKTFPGIAKAMAKQWAGENM